MPRLLIDEMHLESLANEVLLDIFESLSVVDLLYGFYALNSRLNRLISEHLRSFGLDFRSISQSKFNQICRQSLPRIIDDVRFLRLSNDDETPQQIDLFLQYGFSLRQFSQLQSLSLCDLCSDGLMTSMVLEWSHLSNLTRLTLAGCYLSYNQLDALRLMNAIWGLSQLEYCYLNVTFAEENNLPIPTVASRSMKTLSIWAIEYDSETFYALFRQTPSLQDVSLLLDTATDDPPVDEVVFPLVTTLRLTLSSIEEERICRFLKTMPNLHELTVDVTCTSADTTLDGHQWETVIRTSLVDLKVFRLRMLMTSAHTHVEEESLVRLIDSFHTSLWLNKHRWIAQFHLHPNETAKYFYFDTQPDPFASFRLNTLFRENRSTVLCNFSSTSLARLAVQLHDSNGFFELLPTFPQLSTLEVSFTGDNDSAVRQLQQLFDRMPRVKVLSVVSSSISPLLSSLVNTSTVRQLNLQACDQFLDRELCRALARSLLGVQCEVLHISVKDRRSLVDLLEHMIHLRALNIQCEDDLWISHPTSENDELLDWFKEHLPPTATASRDTAFPRDIRIWLR